MELGVDDIDENILGNEENTISGMEKFPYDAAINAFITLPKNTFDEYFQPPLPL